jgi:hypothetical protein
MKYLKRFLERVSFEDIKKDIIELKDIMEDIADEYDLHEIEVDLDQPEEKLGYLIYPLTINPIRMKGLYYRFVVDEDHNKISFELYMINSEFKSKCIELLDVGMNRFYEYLHNNNYNYKEYYSGYGKLRFISGQNWLKGYIREFKLDIWQSDY